MSHCRKVCSSKSHLPACTRAMPWGCEVKGRDVPLQSAQITYLIQSIKRLLSLLQTLAILLFFSIDLFEGLHHSGLQSVFMLPGILVIDRLHFDLKSPLLKKT